MVQPIEGATTFVTGGDVSRFQRKSIPAAQSARSLAAQSMTNASAAINSGVPGGISPRAIEYRSGPVVRVTRGKSTTEVEVGSK